MHLVITHPTTHTLTHILHPHTHTKNTYRTHMHAHTRTHMHAHTRTHMHTQAFNAKSSQNYDTAKKFELASRDWNIGAYIFNIVLVCALLGVVVVVVRFHGS